MCIKKASYLIFLMMLVTAISFSTTSCSVQPSGASKPQILTAEGFLADFVQNISGNQFTVDSLIAAGTDPHSFEPTPQDAVLITSAPLLVINGQGLESWLAPIMKNTPKNQILIEASAGLITRSTKPGEPALDTPDAVDPHYWLNPMNAIIYIENIRDGLARYDAKDSAVFEANANAYIARLKELDAWISQQVQTIPSEKRLLVTNHESLGYFADRYGFKIVGTIIPNVSSSASPSVQDITRLIDEIKSSGATAIFLEMGTNEGIAKQIAAETGVKVVTDLYIHSLSKADGPAATYIDMMHYNTKIIVDALK